MRYIRCIYQIWLENLRPATLALLNLASSHWWVLGKSLSGCCALLQNEFAKTFSQFCRSPGFSSTPRLPMQVGLRLVSSHFLRLHGTLVEGGDFYFGLVFGNSMACWSSKSRLYSTTRHFPRFSLKCWDINLYFRWIGPNHLRNECFVAKSTFADASSEK